MQCNIIGAGKLGLALAQALQKSGRVSIGAICNQSYASAVKSCELLGFGQPIATLQDLPAAAVTFITVNDDHIPLVVKNLVNAKVLVPGSLILHCSGVLASTELSPLKQLGCFIASLHPLKAFRAGDKEPSFEGVFCTLEGDKEAFIWAKRVFENLGAQVLALNSKNKAAYHAAACMASNYLLALAASCETLFLEAGLSSQQTLAIIQNQMQGALDNLKKTHSIKEALTGPLLRGDGNTIGLHLKAIQDTTIKGLYQAAAKATLSLTALSLERKQIISNLLITEE